VAGPEAGGRCYLPGSVPQPAPSRRPRRVIAFFATAAIGVVVLLLLVTAALWQGQERVVWQPPGLALPDPPDIQRLEFLAADSQPLYAYVVGDRERARGALIAFHGNADLAARLVPWGEEVAKRTGALVVLAEYRGYGGLPGSPTYEGSRRDARAAWRATRELLDVPAESIAVFGHSLGSAVATELASALDEEGTPPRVLLLQSPFTSARDMARLIAPAVLLWDLVSRVHFDTERRVRTLRAPVWVSHGTRDLIIPVRMGRRVHAAAKEKGELLIVPAAGHNDVAEVAGDDYWRWLEAALSAASASPPAPRGA